MPMKVEEVTPATAEECDAYLDARSDTTFVDRWSWNGVISRAYDLPQHWFVARKDGTVRGFLGLTLSESRYFGRYLATAPFGDHGGFYADDPEAERVLLEKAKEVQRQVNASYVLVRRFSDGGTAPQGWEASPDYAVFLLPLDPDPEAFYRGHLRSIVRNRIKKARTHGFQVRFGHRELLDDFWMVMNRAVRDLGSPYHSRRYLETVLAKLGDGAQIAMIYTEASRPVGGSLLMHHGNSTTQLHVVCLKPFWSLYANDFLYWSVMEELCRRGISVLDLGRSLVGTGNERFKMKWGPERREIDNWFSVADGADLPHLNQANAKYDMARALWKWLPMPLHRAIGPHLMSRLL
jgi:FemAB-related protein (PEP-CTERM system-associated)